MTQTNSPTLVEVVDIQFRHGQKVYYFSPAGLQLQQGDHVIIDTARGPEYGICTSGIHTISESEVVSPLRNVLRFANDQDEKTVENNRQTEAKAHQICLEKIAEHNLDMQLVSTECTFDGSKILFFFTADERVDFRDLVKNLASVFHTRIELRQIGVRDKAKMVGGLGICGRPFCCASFLDDFQPVSIKMAKTQNLSLNPTKISGTCGRLMCCLKYEQDAYEDAVRRAPKAESFVDTPDGRGTVTEVDLLRERVKVRMELQPETINTYRNEDIAVLRSGKAKKNDPPIPDDLAPISGGGRRIPREEPREEPTLVNPEKFILMEQPVIPEEAPEVPQEQPESPEPKRNNNHRHNRRRKPRKDSPAKAPEAGNAQEPSQSAAAKEAAGEKKKPNRHRYNRHRRPKQNKPQE